MTTKNIERLSGILEQGVDWKTRTMFIVGDIDSDTSSRMIPIVRLLDETKGEIKVILNSNGGDESAGFAIFDTLRLTRNKVVIHGFGGIYSIAALIFQAGSVRYLSPSSQIMIHNGSIGVESAGMVDSNKIEQLGKEASQNNARYHRAIAERAKRTLTEVAEWCKDERHFLAEEAVECGLADGVLEGAI